MENKTLGEPRLSRGPVLLWPMKEQELETTVEETMEGRKSTEEPEGLLCMAEPCRKSEDRNGDLWWIS